jgi:hypothetical protein
MRLLFFGKSPAKIITPGVKQTEKFPVNARISMLAAFQGMHAAYACCAAQSCPKCAQKKDMPRR